MIVRGERNVEIIIIIPPTHKKVNNNGWKSSRELQVLKICCILQKKYSILETYYKIFMCRQLVVIYCIHERRRMTKYVSKSRCIYAEQP